MKELSLFTGGGGGLLASHLLGWTPIGYVEWNDYAQRIIAARIRDGCLPNAPIFGDIRTFISDGYAASYQGMVDVVSGGFPCQPFSNAGKRLGENDPRNMWPATINVIRMVRPRFTLLENVPGLLTSGYFGTILGDLAESGYDARWRILSAAELGAPHKRDRLWIVAHADRAQRTVHQRPIQAPVQMRKNALGASWWMSEPAVPRVDAGMASNLDINRAIGNGQVPAVAAAAWRLLTADVEAQP